MKKLFTLVMLAMLATSSIAQTVYYDGRTCRGDARILTKAAKCAAQQKAVNGVVTGKSKTAIRKALKEQNVCVSDYKERAVHYFQELMEMKAKAKRGAERDAAIVKKGLPENAEFAHAMIYRSAQRSIKTGSTYYEYNGRLAEYSKQCDGILMLDDF